MSFLRNYVRFKGICQNNIYSRVNLRISDENAPILYISTQWAKIRLLCRQQCENYTRPRFRYNSQNLQLNIERQHVFHYTRSIYTLLYRKHRNTQKQRLSFVTLCSEALAIREQRILKTHNLKKHKTPPQTKVITTCGVEEKNRSIDGSKISAEPRRISRDRQSLGIRRWKVAEGVLAFIPRLCERTKSNLILGGNGTSSGALMQG